MAEHCASRCYVLVAALSIALGCDGAAQDASTDAAAGWQPPQVTPPAAESTRQYWLSETGLYRDIESKQLAPDLLAFEPTYQLWSDGADKARWLRLPAGEAIDSSDQDHWSFPVGTQFFKEFSRSGKRLETRMIMRLGPDPEDTFMGAFLWNDNESDALFVPDGVADVRGTSHDVPKVKHCGTCHNGEAGRILGFSAVQQPLANGDLLSAPPALPYQAPGNPTTAAALGYLHANCGHCHNLHGTSWPDTDMDLRLEVDDATPEDTAAYRSGIGVEMQSFDDAPQTLRIKAGDPDQSGILYRMSQRGPQIQMPPLATEEVDEAGVAVVREWIESL